MGVRDLKEFKLEKSKNLRKMEPRISEDFNQINSDASTVKKVNDTEALYSKESNSVLKESNDNQESRKLAMKVTPIILNMKRKVADFAG